MSTSMTSRLSIPNGSSELMNRTSALHSSSSSGSGSGYNYNYNFSQNANITAASAIYLSRLTDITQMDFQSALDQMKSLLSHKDMKKVYKLAYYRKQTKNHWSRDDPAIVFLQLVLLIIASLAYSIAFRSDSLVTSTLYFMFHSVVVNYLASGILLASVGRFIANNHLLSTSASSLPSGTTISPVSSGSSSVHIVRQEVEWMYAFDVHCNAFWLFFVIVYGVQFFLLPIVLGKGFGSFLVSNLLYSAGFFGYFYVTHLGYRGEFIRALWCAMQGIGVCTLVWTEFSSRYDFWNTLSVFFCML